MNVGMLWFDNDPNIVLNAKIARAARYYQQKYGKNPTLCYVHPSMMPLPSSGKKNGGSAHKPSNNGNGTEEEILKAGEVEIRSNRSIMPNHFWIGVNGKVNGKVNGNGSSS